MTDGISNSNSNFKLNRTQLPGVPLVAPVEEEPPKPAKIKLNENEVLLLQHIETSFWETGNVPSYELSVRFTGIPLKEIERIWSEPYFREHLIKRGIDITPTTERKFLTPKQLALANSILNTYDVRSLREKLQEFNISTQTYNGWMRQEAFRGYLSRRVEANFQNTTTVAKQRLAELVDEKDIGAIKFYLEMAGEYNPRVQVDINVQAVMVKIIEVISTHVKDPLVLDAIANDLEQINASS